MSVDHAPKAINKIDGDARTVRALLREKYAIDYYQREYRWERRHVEALIQDLETRFLANYTVGDIRLKVQEYAHYFLGPIVVSRKGGKRFLIDGQQRLTSVTLLLIYLNHLQQGRDVVVAVDELIYSEKYGQKSFHLDVEERRDCMQALFEGKDFQFDGAHGSVATLVARYADIEELFPEELGSSETLPYFLDWLLDNVELVEITTYNDEDAYAIFETMNDRGLSLTPAEMLKAYLLSKLDQEDSRASADAQWRSKMAALSEVGADEDSDFFKAWLRARYARKIRERKAGASNQDFEHIGTAFHKWVRDNGESEMGLSTGFEFEEFLQARFPSAVRSYLLIRGAERELTPGLEYLFYNAASHFTLQPSLLLASLTDADDEATTLEKFRLVAGYIDLFIFRRVINFRTLAYGSIQYTMFNTMKGIRGKSVEELAATLRTMADALGDEAPLDGILTFRLHQQNKPHVRNLLARLSSHLDEFAGPGASFSHYIRRDLEDSFDIEHILADKPERFVPNVYPDEVAFAEARNQIGGLLLVPRSFNASYGALTYSEKRPHYNAQNLLARTLCDECYDHNPKFMKFLDATGLGFVPHADFGSAELASRQELYRDLAAQVWSLDRFDVEPVSSGAVAGAVTSPDPELEDSAT